MNISQKTLHNGFSMPVLGLGTWEMGGKFDRDPDNDDRRDIDAIQGAISLGITHIDTAENYAQGRAEELVGEAIAGCPRSKLFITTKVSSRHLNYRDVLSSAKNSLVRLKTDYIDLYLIHAPNADIPLAETMRAFDELKKQGIIRNIGVSNFSASRLKEAQTHTFHPIVTDQVHYNLEVRECERKGLLQYCQTNDILLTAYRPIQKGMLGQKQIPIVGELCKKYKKTPIQIALNWLMSQQNVVTISKMANGKHLHENLGSIGWEMENSDVERLRQEFPDQKDTSDVATLS